MPQSPQFPTGIDPSKVVIDPTPYKSPVQAQAPAQARPTTLAATPPPRRFIDPASVIVDAPKEKAPSRFMSGVRMTLDSARNTFRRLGANPIETAGEIAASTLAATAAGRSPVVRAMPQAARLLTTGLAAGTAAGTYGAADDAAQVMAGAPPPSVQDVAGRFGERFTTNAVGEGVIAPSITGAVNVAKSIPVRRVGNFIRNRMSPDAKAAAAFVGGKVTPGMVSDSPFVQFMDNLAGATFGRGRYMKVFSEQERAFADQADREIARFGPKATSSEAGEALRTGLVKRVTDTHDASVALTSQRAREVTEAAEAEMSAAERALNRVSNRFGPAMEVEALGKGSQSLIDLAHRSAKDAGNLLYDQVDQLGKGVTVSLDPMTALVKAETERRGALAIALRGGKTASMLKTVGRETAGEGGDDAASEAARMISAGDTGSSVTSPAFLEALQKAGIDPTAVEAGRVTFRQAHEIRSALGEVMRTASRRGDDQARGTASQLRAAIDTSMKEAAGEGTPLAQAYDDATRTWKGMVEKFEEGALAKVMDAQPVGALKAMIGKKGAIDDILLTRETLGDEGWRRVQARAWDDMVKSPSGTALSDDQVLGNLEKWSPAELKAVFGDAAGTIQQEVVPAVGAAQAARKVPGQMVDQVNSAITGKNTAIQHAVTQRVANLVGKEIGGASPKDIPKLEALVGPAGWAKVQSISLQRLLSRVGDDPKGVVTAAQLARRLELQGERLVPLYGQDTANFLHQFVRHRAYLDRTNPLGNSGKMWLQLATPSAVAGMFSGKAAAVMSGGLLVLGPYTMARIATSPQMQRTLIGVMNATRTAEHGTAARLTAQLWSQLVRGGVVNPDGSERAEGSPEVPTPAGRGAGPGALGAAPPTPAGRGPGPRGAGAGPPPQPGGPPAPGF